MNSKELKSAVEKWDRLCETIKKSTVVVNESPNAKIKRIKALQSDYQRFVNFYFPHYVTDSTTGEVIDCAPFHIQAANAIKANRNMRAVFEWARGHAKSTHMDIFIPMWLMIQEPRTINTVILVSKSEEMAKTLLADIQAELQYNQRFINDYGVQFNAGDWQEGRFVTSKKVAFFARGRGQSPRGLRYRNQRPDYIVVDDIDDDELCRNEKRVKEAVNWVKEALFGALDGGRGRFIMVGNLINKQSILQAIINTESVETSQVNIYDKYGNVSWAAKYTFDEVESLRKFSGERAFQKEYMNNPIAEGTIFRNQDIRYGAMLPLNKYRQLVCYTDPSWKNTATSDYKATVLAGITPDGYYHVLKVYAAQTSVKEMVNWHYEIMKYVNGNAPVMYYMEANLVQDLLLAEFTAEGNSRGLHIPIRGDARKKGDKFARIEAMQPLFERGLVILNEAEKNSNGMKVLIEQLLMFSRGGRAHDDAPDALESAVFMLNKRFKTTDKKYFAGKRKNFRF